ncbi:MAG: hypothetical protein NVSMB49_16680 [Ktedonobacteraceae bacterium]
MSFMDKRKGSALREPANSGPLPLEPELVNELSPIEQLSFPDPADILNSIAQVSPTTQSTPLASTISEVSPLTTRQLPGITTPFPSPTATRVLPEITRILPEVRTGDLPRSTTTSLRQPTVIRATGKKSSGTMRPPQGRRMVIHVAVTVFLALIVLGSLIAVVPTDSEGKGYNIFSPIVKYFANKSNNTVLLVQQAATATAVTQDGYDPGNKTFAGVPTAPPSYGGGTGTGAGGGGTGTGTGVGGDGNHFFFGQCTYWAAYRYHQLTGYWVPWLGNAGAWAYNATAFGWNVSSAPRVGSILVLAPGAEGAGPYGHVAIVESINADGSLTTSNFNWAGYFGVMTYVTFYPGPGALFVWE